MRNAIFTALLLAAVIPSTVLAASPHFVGPVTAKFQGNDARVCFKEAGLGGGQTIDYTANADATATYVCVNNGKQCPADPKKTDITGPVGNSDSLTSGKNGAIKGCINISPPSGVTLNCPGNQVATLASVKYENISITDTTTPLDPEPATPSTLEKTLFSCGH